MAKKARRHKHEDHVDESWLVPYADILTLLLALFIVLFASSSVDQQKLNQMSAVFNQVFEGGTGVFENPSPVENIDATSTEVQEAVKKYAEDQKQLEETQEKVEELIAVNELENQFQATMTDEGLLITIRDSLLFESGRAEVKEEQRTVAAELSEILNFNPARNVVITGHTDNVPISNSQFDSNWDLSVSRALNFLKIIIDSNEKLDAKYFSVKGFGEYSPIASNDTNEGRAQNRRVEVLIQPRVAEDGTELPVGNATPTKSTTEKGVTSATTEEQTDAQ